MLLTPTLKRIMRFPARFTILCTVCLFFAGPGFAQEKEEEKWDVTAAHGDLYTLLAGGPAFEV